MRITSSRTGRKFLKWVLLVLVIFPVATLKIVFDLVIYILRLPRRLLDRGGNAVMDVIDGLDDASFFTDLLSAIKRKH